MDFDALKNRLTELTQTGVAKAKELGEIGKLKVANAAEQDAIRKAYLEIGKLYFSEHGSDPDPAYAALCAKIMESKEKIAYNDDRIADIKRASDITDDDLHTIDIDVDDNPDL